MAGTAPKCLVENCFEPPTERGACHFHRAMLDRVKEELSRGRRSKAAVKPEQPTITAPSRKQAPPDFALKLARFVHERKAATTAEVAEAFDVSERTATRHIGRARQEGWIVSGGRGGLRPAKSPLPTSHSHEDASQAMTSIARSPTAKPIP